MFALLELDFVILNLRKDRPGSGNRAASSAKFQKVLAYNLTRVMNIIGHSSPR